MDRMRMYVRDKRKGWVTMYRGDGKHHEVLLTSEFMNSDAVFDILRRPDGGAILFLFLRLALFAAGRQNLLYYEWGNEWGNVRVAIDTEDVAAMESWYPAEKVKEAIDVLLEHRLLWKESRGFYCIIEFDGM